MVLVSTGKTVRKLLGGLGNNIHIELVMFNTRNLLLLSLLTASLLSLIAGTLFYKWLNRPTDFKNLELFLQNQNWSEADSETERLLLRLSKRDFKSLYLIVPDFFEFENIACEDLKTIDKLWSESSNQNFGFEFQLANWKNRIKDIDWRKYRRDPDSPDSEHRRVIFDEIYEQYKELVSTNYSNLSVGELPSRKWILSATPDMHDPVLVAKDFYQRLDKCNFMQ